MKFAVVLFRDNIPPMIKNAKGFAVLGIASKQAVIRGICFD
jgi:hypothetical protein